MSFQDLVTAAQKYFPDLQIKYKDQSWFMKLIGKLIYFFNKSFMTSYTTTIGSTVYFPTESFVKVRPVSAAVVLLHELIHVYDAQRLSKPIFYFLYLFPQILALFCLPLFLVSWKIALPLVLLFAAPLPAYFRMQFEKRAYLTSLYAINKLATQLSFKPLLATQEQVFINRFKDSSYYFMWPFNNLQKDFDEAVVKIRAGQRPYEDPVFDILDELTTKV
jgi:hypothetical protein